MSFLYKIKIDIDNYLPQKIVVRSRQGDKGSHTIHAEIYQNNQRLNLTGYQAQFSSENANGNKTFSNCEIVNNEIVHTLTSGYEKTDGSWALGELDIPGDLNCEFVVTSNANTFTTPSFRIIVDSVIHDSSAIVASDNFDALTVVLAKLDDEITGLASKASITQLNAEKSAREAADTALTNKINTDIAAEKSAREADDTTLTTRISKEEAKRASEDTLIKGQISALTGKKLGYEVAGSGNKTIYERVEEVSAVAEAAKTKAGTVSDNLANNYYNKTETDNKSATTLQSAKDYSDTKLTEAKDYTDTEVAKKQDKIISGYDVKCTGLKLGRLDNSTGSFINVTNHYVTDYIEVTSSGLIYVYALSGAYQYVHFYSDLPNDDNYDESLHLGAEKLKDGTNYVTFPENTCFVRFSIAKLKADCFRVYLADLQEKLVSATNIKTINNESILGSGNITIEGGSSDVFWCTYGETKYARVSEAIEQGKVPIVKVVVSNVEYTCIYTNTYNKYHNFTSVDGAMIYIAYAKLSSTDAWTSSRYRHESQGNKATTIIGNETSTTKYPTTKAVVDYINSLDARETEY